MRSTNPKPFTRARVIRGVLFVSVVMANLEEECAFFTIKKALDCALRGNTRVASAGSTVRDPVRCHGQKATRQIGDHIDESVWLPRQ